MFLDFSQPCMVSTILAYDMSKSVSALGLKKLARKQVGESFLATIVGGWVEGETFDPIDLKAIKDDTTKIFDVIHNSIPIGLPPQRHVNHVIELVIDARLLAQAHTISPTQK